MTVRKIPLLFLAFVAVLASHAGDGGRFPLNSWEVDAQTAGILVEDHRAPIVNLHLEFPAGEWSRWARTDDIDSALKIARYDPEGILRRRSDELAAWIGAFASSRYASLSAYCLKEDLPEVVKLLKEILANDRFDHKELKRWQQQAKVYWKATDTNVQFQARRLVARSLFREEDPRRTPYEQPERVETDVERLKEARDLLVRLPGRTIGLAGDLTLEEAEAIARELLPPALADAGVETEPALQPIKPREERHDSSVLVRRLTQVYFGLGRESLTYDDPDYPAFVLSNHVLGGHFYSRLSVALRHEGGETYGASARSEGGIEPGPFVLGSFTKTDNAAHAEEKMREVLRLFHAEGITEQERQETVSHYLGAEPFSRQTPWQQLHRRLKERRLGLPDGFFDELPTRMAALSLDDINDFIGKYYDPSQFVMGRVAPE
jgi:zinc protease